MVAESFSTLRNYSVPNDFIFIDHSRSYHVTKDDDVELHAFLTRVDAKGADREGKGFK
jgi:hypothetical protein